MSKPIRILHVCKQMGRGGAEMRTLDVLQHIDRRQYQFHFCVLAGLPGKLDNEIRALGGEVHPLRVGLVGFPRRFRGLLRQYRFDVVHSHVHYFSGFLLRLAAQVGTPIRVNYFRSSQDGRTSNLGRRMYRKLMHHWIDRYATNVLAVSEAAMTSMWGPHWKSDLRCQVIYDGLKPSAFEGLRDRRGVAEEFHLPEHAPWYIHVGRMAEAKNHCRLVSIFSELLRRRPTARLLLAGRTVVGRGENTIERCVRRRIAELGIGDRVVFCGERSDVPRLLKAADLLLFPSLWEGLGDVVLEACAAGTPVLASDLPSIREIAGRFPGVHLLSLDEPDTKWAQLAEQLISVPQSDQARQAALRSFADSVFTVERCAETLCRIWQGLKPEPETRGAAHG